MIGDHRMVDAVRRTDSMLVRNDRRRQIRVAAVDLSLFVAAVVAWAFHRQVPIGPLLVASSLVVGLQLGRTGIMSVRRATAYRSGWLDGRRAMVMAMAEAQRRGLSPGEWLTGELERDYAVLGISADDVQRAVDEAVRRHDTPGDDAV